MSTSFWDSDDLSFMLKIIHAEWIKMWTAGCWKVEQLRQNVDTSKVLNSSDDYWKVKRENLRNVWKQRMERAENISYSPTHTHE